MIKSTNICFFIEGLLATLIESEKRSKTTGTTGTSAVVVVVVVLVVVVIVSLFRLRGM